MTMHAKTAPGHQPRCQPKAIKVASWSQLDCVWINMNAPALTPSNPGSFYLAEQLAECACRVTVPAQVSCLRYPIKHGYEYGTPDPVDILPASCSGLCLAAITTLAFVVLSFLTPSPPDTPIVKKWTDQLVLNNPVGMCLPMVVCSWLQPPLTVLLMPAPRLLGATRLVMGWEQLSAMPSQVLDSSRSAGRASSAPGASQVNANATPLSILGPAIGATLPAC
jgi:hypothetical protein